MWNLSYDVFKPFFRFLYYRNERKRVLREFIIRLKQNLEFKRIVNNDVDSLIVFIVDGANWFTGKDNISGGILSIASIYEETKKLKNIHSSEVIMVTSPDAFLLMKHSQFENDILVFRFNQLKKFTNLKSILIHIPEYLFSYKLIECISVNFNYLNPSSVHLNILNQRIDIMPKPEIVTNILKDGYTITQTTAHEQYSTKEIREKFGIPLHKLSVYATPERYPFFKPGNKKELILLSPDYKEYKEEVVAKLKAEFPEYEFKVIIGVPYRDYLEFIKIAKYTITFGEGLDFYFIETVFSGGISFACYNEDFFTKDFDGLNGVFTDGDDMLNNICDFIKKADDDISYYESVNKAQFNACHKIYSGDKYKHNLINFYQKKYLFP